jgi:predicted RNA methylase
MGTGKPRISTAAAEPAGRVVQVELAPGRVLAELELGQVAVLELVIGLAVVPELETAPVVALELVIGPVVVPELVIGQVEAELALEIGPAVVPELVTGQVEAELEHGQGEAELEVVRAAVPLRTKSVITAHHRGLVPLLGAEDLAAEVETTREPAVAEAVIAWEAAE